MELEKNPKRLGKTYHLSKFIAKVPSDDLPYVMALLRGRVFPPYDQSKIGVSTQLMLKALNLVTAKPIAKIEDEWRKIGDLGDVAKKLTGKKAQATLFSESLTVKKVVENIQKLARLEGPGTVDQKVKLIAELLSSSTPEEARFITRTILEELRVGVADGTLRDAIVWAFFSKDAGLKYDESAEDFEALNREEYTALQEAVQSAYDVCNDFAHVAALARDHGRKGLEKAELTVGVPIKVMLAQKEETANDALLRVGVPSDVEYKYDGFRMQIHVMDGKIRLFTRRLEEVTKQFAEVVGVVREHIVGKSFIIDCEAVGFDPKTKRYLPFQSISQRIRREYDIAEMAKKFPVELNVFDIVFHDGKSLLALPFKDRRALLERMVKEKPQKIVLARRIIAHSLKDVESFYHESLKAGNEGVMLKALDAPYKPGARVGFMVKLKPVMETLDLVIVAAEWGEGKRANWLSSFTLACWDEHDGVLVEIGRVGTGIKEKDEEGLSFNQLTELLRPLISQQKGRDVTVKPEIVVEVNYEEIQKSPTYSSGYALRFPRVVRLRSDRTADEISTLGFVEDLFGKQKGKKR